MGVEKNILLFFFLTFSDFKKRTFHFNKRFQCEIILAQTLRNTCYATKFASDFKPMENSFTNCLLAFQYFKRFCYMRYIRSFCIYSILDAISSTCLISVKGRLIVTKIESVLRRTEKVYINM